MNTGGEPIPGSVVQVKLLADNSAGRVVLGNSIDGTATDTVMVYKATLSDMRDDQVDVVVKRVQRGPLAEREKSAFLRIEKHRLAGEPLTHVVQCLAIADEDNYRYFVLERAACDVGSIDARGTDRADLAWATLVGGLRALVELRPTEVVSRDLHPGNFLLRSDHAPSPDDVLVGDFGYAYFPDASPHTPGTRRGIGCVQPPELLLSDRAPDHADDAYSVAVSAFLMLTPQDERLLPLRQGEGGPQLFFDEAEAAKWVLDPPEKARDGTPVVKPPTDSEVRAYITSVRLDLGLLRQPLGAGSASVHESKPKLEKALTLLLEWNRVLRKQNLREVGGLLGIKNLEVLAMERFIVVPQGPPGTPPSATEARSAGASTREDVVLPPYVATIQDFRPARVRKHTRWEWNNRARGSSAVNARMPKAPRRSAEATEEARANRKLAGGIALWGLGAVLAVGLIWLVFVSVPTWIMGRLSWVYAHWAPEVAWDKGSWELWPQWTVAALAVACYLLLLFLVVQSLAHWSRRRVTVTVLSVVAVLMVGSLAYPAIRGSASQPAAAMASTTVQPVSTDCTGSVVKFNQPTSLVCWHLGVRWHENTATAYSDGSFPKAMGWSAPGDATAVTKATSLWASLVSDIAPCQTVYAQATQESSASTSVPGSFVAPAATTSVEPPIQGPVDSPLRRVFNDQTYVVRGAFSNAGTSGLQMYQRMVVQRHGLDATMTEPGTAETRVLVYVLRAHCAADQVGSADAMLSGLMSDLAVFDRTSIDPSLILRSAELGKSTTVQHLTIPVASDVTPTVVAELATSGGALAEAEVGLGDPMGQPSTRAWADVQVFTGSTVPGTATKPSQGWLAEPVKDVTWGSYDAWKWNDPGAATNITGVATCYYRVFNDDYANPLTARVCVYTSAADVTKFTGTVDAFLSRLTAGAGPVPKES